MYIFFCFSESTNHETTQKAKSFSIHFTGWVVTRGLQDLLHKWTRVLALCRTVDLKCMPKFHLVVHMWQRALRQGNPVTYSTFEDEALNKRLKKVLESSHQSCFERLAFSKIDALYARLLR